MIKKIAAWSGLLGVVLFVIATVLGGLLLPGYSHLSQYISESYAIGTPYGPALRYYVFIPSGFLLALFAILNASSFREKKTKLGFWGIGIFYGVATIIVSIFPCDAGCNKELIDPSIAQLIHSLTGMLTYIFVPISLLVIGISFLKSEDYSNMGKLAIASAVISFLFMFMLTSEPVPSYAGLYQRIIEGSILFWILAFSLHQQKRMGVELS